MSITSMRQTRRLRINAPRQRVWELLDDDSKLELWMPNVVSTRYPGRKRGDKSVGMRFVQEMREGDKVSSYEGEITEYKPGVMLGVLTKPQAFNIHVVYHITGDDDWTLLEYGCDVLPTTWRGYMMIWWGRGFLNRILDHQLARLRLVAEGQL